MYEFIKTETGWIVYWGPVPSGAGQPEAGAALPVVAAEPASVAVERAPLAAGADRHALERTICA
jgi:hypothetical protein